MTVTGGTGPPRVVAATLGSDGRWHTAVALQPGQRAQVVPGSVHDHFGEYNGTASAVVTR